MGRITEISEVVLFYSVLSREMWVVVKRGENVANSGRTYEK